MTITVPVAIPAASLPLPDPADRATFSARKLEQLRWANEDLAPGALALASATYDNALDAEVSATEAYENNLATAANAQAAASYAGAVVWITGTTYAIGDVRWSPANRRLYRRLIAGAGATDPSTDGTNWASIKTGRPVITVSTASVTAVAGFDYLLTYSGVVTVTAPASPASEDAFGVIVANNRDDNILNPNGGTIFGMTGNMRIDNAYADMKVMYANTTWRVSL